MTDKEIMAVIDLVASLSCDRLKIGVPTKEGHIGLYISLIFERKMVRELLGESLERFADYLKTRIESAVVLSQDFHHGSHRRIARRPRDGEDVSWRWSSLRIDSGRRRRWLGYFDCRQYEK